MKVSVKAIKNTKRKTCFCKNCFEKFALDSNECKDLLQRAINLCPKCGQHELTLNIWLDDLEYEDIFGQKLIY